MNTLETLFEWMLTTGWRASALVLLVFAVRALAGKRLSARWRYALWLPVLAADQVPLQPHPDQDQLIARLLLDRIQAANLKERPATDRDWSRVGYFNDLIQNLTDEDKFGAALKDALLREAGRREFGSALKNAGFGLWR